MTCDGYITAMEEIKEHWGEDGKKVVECAMDEHKVMTMSDFLDNCYACGGNWGGMLLSGMKVFYPKTYEAIPEDMGLYAWQCICDTLVICGVRSED